MATLKPALLAALLQAPALVAQRLVGLRLALPACDVKQLVLRDPALLLRVCASCALITVYMQCWAWEALRVS